MKTTTTNLAYISLMAAILCILAPISIPIPVSSISITLATLVIYFIAYILEPKQALAAVGIYLLLGAVGLPVFSGYLSGVSRFAAPGGGYLVGYLFLAGISSVFSHRFSRPLPQILGMFLATCITYCIGTFWLAKATNAPFLATLPGGALVFLPLDIVKMLFACWLGRKLQLHLQQA